MGIHIHPLKMKSELYLICLSMSTIRNSFLKVVQLLIGIHHQVFGCIILYSYRLLQQIPLISIRSPIFPIIYLRQIYNKFLSQRIFKSFD